MQNDESWILPKNLREQEKRERQLVDQGSFDGKGDFGSYYALLTGKNKEWVRTHNMLSDEAEVYSNIVRSLWGVNGSRVKTVLDIGCGAGYITHQLFRTFSADSALGIDISRDAVEFANRAFHPVQYREQAVEPESKFGGQFDLIHSREFYPFTRTNDPTTHIGYLKCLVNATSETGIVAVSLRHSHKCLLNTVDSISSELKSQFRVRYLGKRMLPSTKLFRIVPNLRISRMLTWCKNELRRQENSYLLLFCRD